MPLYEYICEGCQLRFEELCLSGQGNDVHCPKCDQTGVRRLVSIFGVTGRGDLRESTLHGCHNHSACGGHGSHSDAQD